MRRTFIYIFYLMIVKLLTTSCNNGIEHKTQSNNDTRIFDSILKKDDLIIDLEELLGNPNNGNSQVVQISYDHYFKKPKRYKGYYIAPLIDSIIKAKDFDTTNTIAIFECNDGYKPMMDISKIFTKVKGYIAYKDLDEGNVKNWADSINEKFHPFYLVWDSVKKEDQSFMWPYGLKSIRISRLEIQFKTIYPEGNNLLINGFNLFRNNCMKCHSLNKVGGKMGPELNIPKNITEYWKDEDLVAFIKTPSSYRYNSSMPGMTNLTNSDLKHIVEYIKYMKSKKIQ